MTPATVTITTTELTHCFRQGNDCVKAIELNVADELVYTAMTECKCDIILFASNGKAARFKESAVSAMGRVSRGVRGIRMGDEDRVVGMVVPEDRKSTRLNSSHVAIS